MNQALADAGTVPLTKDATLACWTKLANTEPTDLIERFNVAHRRDEHYSIAYLEQKYNLRLKEGVATLIKHNRVGIWVSPE